MEEGKPRKLLRFKLEDKLIIPYGFKNKWDINKLKIVGVDDKATYFESELPCFCLDKLNTPRLSILDINSITTLDVFDDQHGYADTAEMLLILKYLQDKCETEHERQFLKHYFDYFMYTPGISFSHDALLPVPQAHLYFKDPLTEDEDTFVSQKSNRVDFLFWNGEKIIIVEIDGDGPSHAEGNSIAHEHIIKDRKFQHVGVQIIHILNKEIDEIGIEVIDRLLPIDILGRAPIKRED